MHALDFYNQRNKIDKNADASHDMFNTHHDLLVKALSEYATLKGITKYSANDFDDLAWYGTEKSKQFSTHFEELAKLNKTTKEEEVNKWTERIQVLTYEYEKWKRAEGKEEE